MANVSDVCAFFEADTSNNTAYTDPSGVVWKKIRYPNFRESPCRTAWHYASDQGHLLSKDLRILCAQPGKGYVSTTLPIHIEGTHAASTKTSVHRIIAYTFLGLPPVEGYTVDHLNRIREDNRAVNLRWASPVEQMTNRALSQYRLSCANGRTYTSLHELAQDTQTSVATLSTKFRHTLQGDVVQINGLEICVEAVNRTPIAHDYSMSVFHKYGGQKKKRKQQDVALELFVEGKTVADVARVMGIKTTTVLSYLGMGARECSGQVAEQVAERLGVTCVVLRQKLAEGIRRYHESLDSSKDYMVGYKRMVLDHLPDIGEDWAVIKYVFQAIHHVLQNYDAPIPFGW